MSAFDFILTFKLPNGGDDSTNFVDALFDAGYDDATLGVGKHGFIAVDFTRDADSVEAAVGSAIAAVEAAVPGAESST